METTAIATAAKLLLNLNIGRKNVKRECLWTNLAF